MRFARPDRGLFYGYTSFRIAQEAVSNAIKHGQAKQVTIWLSAAGPKIVLMVKDNGLGLPKDLTRAKGMGLRIMHYRASLIGGSLAGPT